MGQVAIPTSRMIYLDAQILIYSVERHPRYALILQPLWDAVQQKLARVVASQLSILECLAEPMRTGNNAIVERFDSLFTSPEIQLEAVSEEVLRLAAKLRAAPASLRAPDAIHAATSLICHTEGFLTNDRGFEKLGLAGLVQVDQVGPIAP
jgi:predicted nucleic acid-binding protein